MNRIGKYASWGLIFFLIALIGNLLMLEPSSKPSFEKVQLQLAKELADISKDFENDKWEEKIASILKNSKQKWEDSPQLQDLYNKPYKLFIWKKDSLIFWNGTKDLSLGNINKISSDYHYATRDITLFPYRIEIQYPVISTTSHMVNEGLLRNSNSTFDFVHTNDPSPYKIKLNVGEKGFHLQPIPNRQVKSLYIVIFGFYLLSLIFFLIELSDFAIKKSYNNPKLSTLAIYLLVLIAIKLFISLITPSSLGEEFILFSSKNTFGLYQNIADFLLSSLFIFFGVVVMNKILNNDNIPLRQSMKYWLIPFQWSIIIGFLLIISACRGLVLETNMHFNVEEIYSIDKYSLLTITAVLFMLLSLFTYSSIYNKYIKRFDVSNKDKVLIFLSSTILSIPVFYYLELNISVLITFGFILLYFLLLDLYFENTTLNISWLIFWMILFSGFTSVLFYNYSLEHEILQRKSLVQSLYKPTKNEIIAELIQLKKSIDNTGIISTIQLREGVTSNLKQYDLIQFLNTELNYNKPLQLESFDQEGNSIFSGNYLDEARFLSYFILKDSISPDIQHDPFSDQYIIKYKSVESSGNSYFVIPSGKDDFHELTNESFKNNSNVSLLIKQDENVIFRKGKFDFNSSSDIPKKPVSLNNDNNTYIGNGQLIIYHKPRQDIELTSYKKIANIIKPISFFSYIFTLIGLLILITVLLNLRYNFLSVDIKFDIRHSLRLKLQFTVLAMIVISFVMIGAITSYYFQNLIKKEQYKDVQELAQMIGKDVQSKATGLSDDKAISLLSKRIPALADIYSTDLVLFNKGGKSLNTSQINQRGAILSYPIWYKFNHSNQPYSLPKSLEHKKIENTSWESYIPIYNHQNYIGSLLVKHPKVTVLSNSVLELFSALLNVYVFIFLLAVFIAIAVSNSITKPLKLLATKIVNLKLGKQNEPINWKGQDEVGLLIQRYNEMLTKIDTSAQILAKTQRDQAWSEMAKQVAHEIKNPLTPMKLSMQHLERMVTTDPERATKMVPRISKTLIEQIDNLSGIANAFSSFAKMPKASNRKILLNDVVETTHDLFRERDDMDIRLIEPIEDIHVFADKNHLVRILNNLLKNAMQAIPEDRRGDITIALYTKGDQAIIKVTDNGIGIPDEMLDKVFTPNFTTKSSGTGLGLPIVANMIETFNGKIYFETEYGVGTSFFVEIPKMRMQNMEKQGERVSLD